MKCHESALIPSKFIICTWCAARRWLGNTLSSPFPLMSFEEYLDLICEFVERLKPSIVIERLFGEAPLGLLVAPDWGKTRNEVMLGIRRRMDELNVIQGAKCQPVSGLHAGITTGRARLWKTVSGLTESI